MISKDNSNETTVRGKGPVANKPFGQFVKQAVPEDFFDELTFVRRSASHANGERKTVTIGDSDDRGPLASARGTDRKAPFFRAYEGCIDERFLKIEFASLVQMLSQQPQDPL